MYGAKTDQGELTFDRMMVYREGNDGMGLVDAWCQPTHFDTGVGERIYRQIHGRLAVIG